VILRISCVALLLALAAPRSPGQGKECTCNQGKACYHQLRCPSSAPADPDPCPACLGSAHENPPKEWNDPCWQSPRMACFLRRHAASWGISCSLCLEDKCCPFPNWKNCPECHGDAAECRDPGMASILDEVKNQKAIGGKAVEMAMSGRYVIVTDLRGVKIATERGSPRYVTKHELMHLYLQRAEQARKDFEDHFGGVASGRSVMVIVESDGTRRQFSKVYFGNQDTNLLYGSGRGGLAGGLAGNGFAISGRDDDDLQFTCRHMIGHLCISSYAGGEVNEKHLPQWLFRGAAHWLSKLHPRAKDFSTYCAYEGITVSGSGKNWEARARGIAARGPSNDPVERMLQAATAKTMTYDLHVRSWSYFEVFLREERESFVRLVQLLRKAMEPRAAFKEAFGQAPEYVDDRWRERVLGKRSDVQATTKERNNEVDADAASSRELADIGSEADLSLLAGKIRGLERCQNIKTARLLVSMVDGRDSDRVREVISLVLSRTTDEEVLAWMRGEGYEKAGKLGRAALLRMFGEARHQPARDLLVRALSDGFWLARANAARSLAQLQDKESIVRIGQIAGSDGEAKVRIAAMDALAAFGPDAGQTVPLFESNLGNRAWQVKTATCAAFKALGNSAAVDTLIARLDREGGRIHDDIRQALKALTGMDKEEWDTEKWTRWWGREKRFREVDEKMREQLEKEGRETPEPEGAGGETRTVVREKEPPNTYYGIKLYAKAVGYVLDISQSMEQGFRVSEGIQEKLGRTYNGTSRIEVCREELAQSITALDPRTRFNIVFFNDKVRSWKDAPVPAAPTTKDSAISAIRNAAIGGQTNHYDALKEILQMRGGAGGWSPDFGDTPDTIFFLTDGTPTDGEITKADELLGWLRERNRFARLRVHVIAMGNTGVDLNYLRRLAEENEGTFLHFSGDH